MLSPIEELRVVGAGDLHGSPQAWVSIAAVSRSHSVSFQEGETPSFSASGLSEKKAVSTFYLQHRDRHQVNLFSMLTLSFSTVCS